MKEFVLYDCLRQLQLDFFYQKVVLSFTSYSSGMFFGYLHVFGHLQIQSVRKQYLQQLCDYNKNKTIESKEFL